MDDPDSACIYHLRRAQQEAVSAIRAGAWRIAALHEELSLRHSLEALAVLMACARFVPSAGWTGTAVAAAPLLHVPRAADGQTLRGTALTVRYADGPWPHRRASGGGNPPGWSIIVRRAGVPQGNRAEA